MKNNKTTSLDQMSVVIPLYNGGSTIAKTMQSLYGERNLVSEVIIINDGSTDNSEYIIHSEVKKLKGLRWRIISHKKSKGLASCYNEGILFSKKHLVMTLHQDMILYEDTLRNILEPFKIGDIDGVAVSISGSEYPLSIWKTYPFWQKCLFSRFVGKTIFTLDGKCTLFNKNKLIQVGLFDSVNHRTAGEDGDMRFRIGKIGKIVQSRAKAIHLHSAERNFSLHKYIAKHAQLAEAQGVLLRKYGFSYYSPRSFSETFFREILVLGTILPYVGFVFIILIILYCYLYTRRVYGYCRDLRCISLPFINIYLLLISLFYSLRGYITGKQRL